MARKITTGRVGRAVLGNLTTVNNSLQSVVTNANVLIEPNGTGIVQSTRDLQVNAQNSLRLADADSSNFVALRAPATVSANVTYTFPEAAVNNTVLRTDTNGVLSWVAPFVAVDNQTADTATYYPTLTTVTSGTASTVSVSNTKLSFVPSTGVLSATTFSGSFSGNGASITNVAAASAATVTLTADNSTNATRYPLFSSTATGNQSPRTDTGFTYNPSSGELTAVIITASSDLAVKKDIVTLDSAIEKVMRLRGVSYRRKDNNIEEIGVIAQEVEKVLPSLVRGEDGNKSVAYGNIVAVLIEAIKYQQEQIENIKEKLV